MACLERILIAGAPAAPMRDRHAVDAVAGRGLAGDRYHAGRGTFSSRMAVAGGARDVSLIDTGAVRECARRLGQAVDTAALRRNLLIDGLDLMAMRGCVLQIGAVRLKIVGSCPPCGLLSRRTGLDMRQALRGIGGMRAAVYAEGRLRVAAPIGVEP